MEYINTGMASMLFGVLLGYYLGERGWNGVKIDMGNIKTDVEVLKAKVEAKINPAPVSPVLPLTVQTPVISAPTPVI
jgi:hypothetical protein